MCTRRKLLLDGLEGLTQRPHVRTRAGHACFRQFFNIEIHEGVEGQATDFLEDGVGRVSLEDRLLRKAAGSGFELVEDLESHLGGLDCVDHRPDLVRTRFLGWYQTRRTHENRSKHTERKSDETHSLGLLLVGPRLAQSADGGADANKYENYTQQFQTVVNGGEGPWHLLFSHILFWPDITMNAKKYVSNVLKSLRKSVTAAKASNANVVRQLRNATRAVKKVGRSVKRVSR